MQRKYMLGGVSALVLAAGGVGIAQAVGGDDDEGTLTGPQAEKATAAALKATDGGTANAVERDGENGATWEVEITKTDGKTVDVRLDENFGLVVIEGDSESETGDSDSGPDD